MILILPMLQICSLEMNQPAHSRRLWRVWLFCLTIYEKRARWAQFSSRLDVCRGRSNISSGLHHHVESKVVEFGSTVWHGPVSFSKKLIDHSLCSVCPACVQFEKGRNVQLLMCLLFFCFVSWLFMRTDVSRCSWCWAAAVWAVDQTLALLFLWVIRRIELTEQSQEIPGWLYGKSVCVCVCVCCVLCVVCWATRVPSTPPDTCIILFHWVRVQRCIIPLRSCMYETSTTVQWLCLTFLWLYAIIRKYL